MFVEYIRILDFRATGDAGVNYYQLLLKLGIIGTVGVALIYLAYKALGKIGAISVLIFELAIFAIANDLIPFIHIS